MEPHDETDPHARWTCDEIGGFYRQYLPEGALADLAQFEGRIVMDSPLKPSSLAAIDALGIGE